MGNVLVDESILQGWADVVREKHGIEDKMKPAVLLEKTREIGGSGEDFWRMYDGVTNYNHKFANMSNLMNIQQFDTSNGTNFNNMFYKCSSLTNVPQFDTSNGTNFNEMFYECVLLKTVPYIDTSNGTHLNSMFWGCESLETLPDILNTSNATDIRWLFGNCKKIIRSPKIYTAKVTICDGLYQNCTSLVTIPELDFSNVKYDAKTFFTTYALENISFVKGSIKVSFTFAYSPLLSDASIQSIIDGLADLTGATAQTITFHADVKAKLTETQIATITSKNWTLA